MFFTKRTLFAQNKLHIIHAKAGLGIEPA